MSDYDNLDDVSKMRHSLAHVLAQAVLKLWPDTQITIGPPIETGCYYDFLFKTPVSDADFGKIEKEMKKIIYQGQTFRKDELSVKDAIKFWKDQNQQFKVELIQDLEKNEGVKIVTNYANIGPKGEDAFTDLCRGGHVESTKDIPVDGFKIMSIAGAYWRGDEKREQLSRIYVAAFSSKEELDAYLKQLEEARKRDHRKIGKEMDLFTFSDLVGPGLPLWTPRGTLMRHMLDGFVWQMREEKGYQRVSIPHVTKKDLYEKSGHWQKFKDELFRITTREGHEFAMKPMNCPHHTQIYSCQQRSYKSLPQRYAETTTCYRDEQTGELHGLSRVRAFAQDDAHVFCRAIQVEEEFLRIWDIIDKFYKTVGFGQLNVRLSLHDPKNFDKYLGTPELWQQAENSIRNIAKDRGVNYIEALGEAAFYGPKVDFMVKDSIGREWQVATIQLDINLPERFDLYCINEAGERERIVMIHAAIMGSLERFMSIFIEHSAGHFPLWLSPIHAAIIPVAPDHEQHAANVGIKLMEKGIRMEYMSSEESLGKRIRAGEQQRIPYLLVIGEKEIAENSVAVRNVRTKQQVTIPLDEFIAKTTDDIASRKLEPSIGYERVID
jgi:threonyl-tRNA synthetase